VKQIQQIVVSVLVSVLCGVWLWAIATPPAIAQTAIAQIQNSYQGNQAMGISASLVAPDPDMEIDIYPQPNTRKPRIGYGINGDPVVVLEQTGSNTGTTWNRIQFEGAEDAEGWVQLEYLSIQISTQQDQGYQSNANPDRYMGNRSSRQQQQSSLQDKYQRNQQQNYR